jgi:hypothetical protein
MPPVIVPHPNTVRGPIEETNNALRDAREKQYVTDKAALEADYHADLAAIQDTKETALMNAGLNPDGGVPESYPGPRFRGVPQITGTPTVGQTLTCVPGAVDNDTALAYQWQRDGVDIGGATANTRVLAGPDEGAIMTCKVTATGALANTTKVSEPAGPIAAA